MTTSVEQAEARVLRIDDGALRNGILEERALSFAAVALRETGVLVLDGLYPSSLVAHVRDAFTQVLQQAIQRPNGFPMQRSQGQHHVTMQPPLVEPFANPDLIAHRIIIQILSVILGDDLWCSYFNANIAFPGSTTQEVHRDQPHLFGSELQVATPACAVVANIPLCSFSDENGSTEIWPRSHMIVGDRNAAQTSQIWVGQELASQLPSMRMNIPAGSAVIRDTRLWHRGMPNLTDQPRPMLSVVYNRNLQGNGLPASSMTVPRSTWETWPDGVRSVFRAIPLEAETATAYLERRWAHAKIARRGADSFVDDKERGDGDSLPGVTRTSAQHD